MSNITRLLVTLSFSFFIHQMLIAQMTSSGWVSTVSGSGFDTVSDIVTDSEGNSITIGGFSGTVNFSGLSSNTMLTSSGERDIFISKHSTEGELMWVTKFGSSSDDLGFSVDINDLGEIYAVGYFKGTIPFDENTILSNSGREDIFISKLSADGKLLWVKNIGGDNTDEANDVAVDNNGDIYVVGRFVGTVDFDPGSGTENLQSFGGPDAFAMKLNSDGEYLWAYDFGASGNEECEAVAVDGANNVVITGSFSGTTDFDPSAEEVEIYGDGLGDPFYLKLDPSGSLIWVKTFTSTGFVYSADIAIDNDDNIVAHGFFSKDMNFNPESGNNIIGAVGAEDAFTVKLNVNGDLMWANVLGGSSIEFGYGVAVDIIGDVYVTGFYYEDPDFDPSSNTVSLPSTGIEDCYIVKYDSQGSFLWVKQIGGSLSNSGYGIDIGPSGDIFLAGSLWGTANLDPEPDQTLNVESGGSSDIFILKINQIVSSTENLVDYYDISFSPNPTADKLTIHSNVHLSFSATLVNDQGQLLRHPFTVDHGEQTIDMQDLPNGIYYLILESGTDKVVKKISKM